MIRNQINLIKQKTMKKMNKKGLIPVAVWIILALLVVYLAVPGVMTSVNNLFKQPGTGVSETTINTVNPLWAVSAIDKQSSGTDVTVTIRASTDDGGFTTVTTGTTTQVQGQTIDVLFTNNTHYHNAILKDVKIASTTFPLTVYLDKNASVTENIYSTTGSVLSNSVGAWITNQTDLGNGATYNLKDEMQAASLTSTNDMLCVVEVVAGTNVSTSPVGAILTGGSGATSAGNYKPSWYSVNSSNSAVYLFDVKPLSTSATQTFNLQLNSKSTGRFSATAGPAGPSVIKTCYTKEWFIDSNTGKLTYDVADTSGTLMSIANYRYQFAFQ